ncbi:MAG: response regulator [Flavobacteriaceae bacterium]|nr:response regulator [Flavobacteriaceae bacterium]
MELLNETKDKNNNSPELETIVSLNTPYSVENLDNTKGLSNSSVNTIFQDSENLLWIGTWDGLNRYDGNNFKIYRPEPNNKERLSNQVILKIEEDHTGLLWVLTMNGINSYDKKTNSFQQFKFKSSNKFTFSENEYNMAISPKGNLFCAVKDWGIGYYAKGSFLRIGVRNLPDSAVKKMSFTSDGRLILLFDNGDLFMLSFRLNTQGRMVSFSVQHKNSGLKDFTVFTRNKLVCLKANSILECYNFVKGSFFEIGTGVKKILGKTSKGVVVSSNEGIYTYTFTGSKIKEAWVSQVNKSPITTLFETRDHFIWTGSDGDGLFKMFQPKKMFEVASNIAIPAFDKGIVRTFSITKDDQLIVGTKGKGLFVFSSKDQLKNGSYTNYNQNNSAIDNAVFSLFEGEDQLVYIGTDGAGISIYDQKKKTIIEWDQIVGTDRYPYFAAVYAIYQDDKGVLWIGTNGYGLIKCTIYRQGNRLIIKDFRNYKAGEIGDNALSSNIVFSVIPKSKNELWIGTRLGGLNVFDKKEETFKVFKNKEDDPRSLSNNDILCLFEDVDKKLWIGTSFGLNLIENTANEELLFKNYTVKDGLPNNSIHGVIGDTDGKLWLSTSYGLSRFDPTKLKFVNFTKQDGLQNNEFSDGAFYKDKETGVIYMGGIKGFNYFHPKNIKQSQYIPDLFIHSISGQHQEKPYYQHLRVVANTSTAPSIVLNHDQNFFDIEMSALTFLNANKCEYSYYLEGFNTEWNDIGNRKTISFTNVPHGEYSLWVKWSNSDGVWSAPVKAIHIKIKPIIWKTDVAILVYVLLFLLLMILFVSYYQKRHSLKQTILFRKKDEEIHQNRLTFFTNIAHELQTPLTLIVGPAQKLSESDVLTDANHRFVKMIQRNSSRLLFLTQQLLEFRKAEYDHLEVSVTNFDVVHLLEQIAELFDELALGNHIKYEVRLDSNLEGWFDKDKIEKIVFNLLSNAFKYTPVNGRIEIKAFIHSKEELVIEILNSGVGIPKEKMDSLFDRFFLVEKQHDAQSSLYRTGIGLAYVKKLVTILNGRINVESTVNELTCFSVYLPCKQSSFKNGQISDTKNSTFISSHLQNILEDVSDNEIPVKDKIAALETALESKKTILIVEDEKEIQGLLESLLEKNYKLITAVNGVEALKIMETLVPDIIISDVMMPQMDGIEFCAIVKKNRATCHIPFIMLTARNSVQHKIEGLESGANSFISKPFYPAHLLIRVKKLLEEKELIRKHFEKESFIDDLTSLPVKSDDKDFMKKVMLLIRENIKNEQLNSLFLEKEIGMSSSHLYRTIKELFGFSPGDLIRTIKLKHAAELLRKSDLTVSEICYESGFNNRSYFYREFKKLYKSTPKSFQINQRYK